MHDFAPSSARGLLRELKRFQTSFSGHKCIKNVGGRAPPGPAGELKRFPRPPSRSGGGKLQSLATVWCPLRGREVRNESAWNGRRYLRRGYFKPDIVSDLKFRSKCMFLRRA